MKDSEKYEPGDLEPGSPNSLGWAIARFEAAGILERAPYGTGVAWRFSQIGNGSTGPCWAEINGRVITDADVALPVEVDAGEVIETPVGLRPPSRRDPDRAFDYETWLEEVLDAYPESLPEDFRPPPDPASEIWFLRMLSWAQRWDPEGASLCLDATLLKRLRDSGTIEPDGVTDLGELHHRLVGGRQP